MSNSFWYGSTPAVAAVDRVREAGGSTSLNCFKADHATGRTRKSACWRARNTPWPAESMAMRPGRTSEPGSISAGEPTFARRVFNAPSAALARRCCAAPICRTMLPRIPEMPVAGFASGAGVLSDTFSGFFVAIAWKLGYDEIEAALPVLASVASYNLTVAFFTALLANVAVSLLWPASENRSNGIEE